MSCFMSGRTQTRRYTNEYYRIHAKTFKNLIDSKLGDYTISGLDKLSPEFSQFKLIESVEWSRIMIFTIVDLEVPIPLQQDNSSASNKCYLVCPCCVKQKQHLYAYNNIYACRQCANLHYVTQSERKPERLRRRIRRLRVQIWGDKYFGVNDMFERSVFWHKPKGLHQTTFQRKRDKLSNIEFEYSIILHDQMERLLARLPR